MQTSKNFRQQGPFLHVRRGLVYLLLFLFVLCPALPATAGQSGVKLTILHLNDTHGHIIPFIDKSVDAREPVSGGAYFAEMIRRERAANPGGALLLSAGDMYQGTPISNIFRGRPVIELMNYLKFDAMTLGNHEFDWGQDVLRKIVSQSAFPVLSANITGRGGKYFPGVKSSILLTKKGVPIGIIGVTTTEAEYTSKPGNLAGLTIAPPARVVPPLIKDLRARGAALIIVLSHIGLDEDRKLARDVPGIDVIVGGHSHTVVPDPVVESGTVIVQAGSYGVYLGVLEVLFDPARKKVLSYTQKDELKLVSAGPGAKADPGAAKIVAKYEKRVKGEFSKVVGAASTDLTRVMQGESNLGDLIADAMREASGAQIAFENGGGIRADILKGPITLERIFTVLPFDNQLVTMDLTGEQVKVVLEHSAVMEKTAQVSGLNVEYDLTKPDGSKVVSVTVGGKPLDPDASYRVVTNDFLAAGGDRFTTFTEGRNPVFGAELRDVVGDYIRGRSPVDAQVQGRIVFKK
ncbi:MAG: bifunctional UDP-sugar hydrolase/5'-nucleotidase [Syntrophobacteraceae bacterium]